MSDDRQTDIIKICEGLLERARTGEMTGIGVVEFQGERAYVQMRSGSLEDMSKAPMYLGYLIGSQAEWNMTDDTERDEN